MKSNVIYSFHGRLFVHIILSTMLACVLDFLLIISIKLINRFINDLGYENVVLQANDRTTLFLTLLYILIGILIFSVSFALMQHRQVQYMQKLSIAMHKISNGDLTTTVDIEGDNELSQMAMELNQMAEQVRSLMEREREAERTKNDLITNVAHDLRTPLTSIIGYLELLSSNRPLDEEMRKKYLSIAYQKSCHLQVLIEDLFGFTSLGYGKITAKMTELDIVNLLAQLLDEFYPIFEQNHLEYSYNTNVSSKIIVGDGTLLARLFDNLLNNAVKYGNDGKMINVILNAEETAVTIQVINFGSIIPANELNTIFEKFYRMEQSRSTQTGGTGLGLAIAKNIVDVHNGSITAESSLNGTIFKVVLPTIPSNQKQPFSS
ncbi:MAG TPA: HAMP domain-containing histidine kinase [Candidatus Fimimorpha faecalis]|uniref:histidine kinase n=1 Tax=Candidatus Fimimorpha faecalis TaxID=2840824 RepID=A0A9D1JDP0_9FIRM|nr:HAMP domain-containing histidine kinase [Candidatus Fimimorpha faecalis]